MKRKAYKTQVKNPTAKQIAARTLNAAKARGVRDANYLPKAAALLVALYHSQRAKGHEHPTAWESAALSIAGDRRDIREAAKQLLSVSGGPAAPRHQAPCAAVDASIHVLCDDGKLTTNPVNKKARM
jgi:hypothetical protein